MRRSRLPKSLTVVLGGLLATVVLVGCQQAEDAAQEAAGDAACSVAQSAVDEAAVQARQAVDDIGADPAAAERELRGVRDALTAAELAADGELETQIVAVRTAVEDLLGQAQDAAAGTEVDTAAVEGAREDLDRAVEDVTNFC